MKVFKKIACSVLALGLVLGLTACSPKAFDHQKFIDFCEDQDFNECDERDDYYRDFSNIITGHTPEPEAGLYISCDGKDAQDIYDVILNRFGDFDDYDVEFSSSFAYCDGKGFSLSCLFTCEDKEDAQDLFKELGKTYADDGEHGDKKGYSYYIEAGETDSDAQRKVYTGVYLRGNTVLFIRSVGVKADFVDDFCKAFDVISPTDL